MRRFLRIFRFSVCDSDFQCDECTILRHVRNSKTTIIINILLATFTFCYLNNYNSCLMNTSLA